MNRYVCDERKCCDCDGCKNVCPVNAIMLNEKYVYTEPKYFIDTDKCISCGRCSSVCPKVVIPETYKIRQCMGGFVRTSDLYNVSSSGGFASAIAYSFIKEGGCVYGAGIENNEVRHIRVADIDEICRISGSKYVVSNLDLAYKSIRDDLKMERNVLFIGVPCQVAAIKNVFKNYKNLFTIDLVCHGNTPQTLLHDYLTEIGLHSINDLSFRKKEYFLNAASDKKKYKRYWKQDYYYIGFEYGLSFMEGCYTCEYANDRRVGDLTLGDFWGLSEENRIKICANEKKNISMMLINNDKGKILFDGAKDLLKYAQVSIQEAIEGNSQLKNPAKKNIDRDTFLKKYLKERNAHKALKTKFTSRIRTKSILLYLPLNFIQYINKKR